VQTMTRFIAVEGVDGSGKSTQAQLLSRRLAAKGYRTHLIHFPRYDSPIHGVAVGRFLRGEFGPVEAVHPWLVALLFAGDRSEAAPHIRALLDDDVVVIADRYLYSNLAFQTAKVHDEREKERLREWLWKLEVDHNRIPVPDLSIFLDAPLSFVERQLTHSVGRTRDHDYLEGHVDIHESSLELQRSVRLEYLLLAARHADLAVLDCSSGPSIQDPTSISKAVEAIVTERLMQRAGG
jgi:dTMP kinase